MPKIPCGGFYVDSDIFYFEDNVLKVVPDALRGVQGAKGDKGDPFTIIKIYESISAMNDDFDNEDVPIDSFVLIEDGTDDGVDNGKLYIKADDKFDFVTNLSGAQGIKGEHGEPGVGIPTGGHDGQILYKLGEEDYVSKWSDAPDMTEYYNKTDLDGRILPEIATRDNGKVLQVINGEWASDYFVIGQIIYSESSINVAGYSVPRLTESQTSTIYNAYIAGKTVIISNAGGTKHYAVISVDGSDATNMTAKVLFEDKLILTYNKFGMVQEYKEILDGELVELSREYAVAQNDHGYTREWRANQQGKVWAECGVVETISAGATTVTLPITYEDTNYFTNVTAREQGNFHIYAYPLTKNTVSVRATDIGGSPMGIKVSVEARGWEEID